MRLSEACDPGYPHLIRDHCDGSVIGKRETPDETQVVGDTGIEAPHVCARALPSRVAWQRVYRFALHQTCPAHDPPSKLLQT